MTGYQLRFGRNVLGLSQSSAAANCDGTLASAAFIVTKIATAEAAPNATIANATSNAICERILSAHLNDLPPPI